MAGSHRKERDDPASDLFDRWMSHRTEEPVLPPAPAPPPAAAPAPRATPVPAPPPATPIAPPAAPPADPAPIARRVGRSMNVDFTPRSGARRAVALVLVLAVAGLLVATMVAVQDPTTLTLGVAGVLLVLVLALWAIRAASPVAHLSVHAGRLEVVRGGQRDVFELASNGFTPIEVRGRPGQRSWKVLFVRRGMEPFVVDASMVDPHQFMDVLRRYRPE